MTNKKELSERDIITQFIIPAIEKAGWDFEKQAREEVYFTYGRTFVIRKRKLAGELMGNGI
jgi:type I restriction enzyme, R subunit